MMHEGPEPGSLEGVLGGFQEQQVLPDPAGRATVSSPVISRSRWQARTTASESPRWNRAEILPMGVPRVTSSARARKAGVGSRVFSPTTNGYEPRSLRSAAAELGRQAS
jgi:hypothetical protein